MNFPETRQDLPSVFISYRTADTETVADRLAAELKRLFGDNQVFFDRRTIEPGDTWPDRIKTAVNSAAVVLVLIGKKWLTEQNDYGRRRLDVPEDWVRREVETALENANFVIPVLVDGASLPPQEAFADLQGIAALSKRQGARLRTEDWDTDRDTLVERLVAAGLRELMPSEAQRVPQNRPDGSLDLLFNACQKQVRKALNEMEPKYNPKLYVHRAIEKDLENFIDGPLVDRNCYLVIAPAGSGKTNVLCALAEERLDVHPLLLLTGGNINLRGSSRFLSGIQEELQVADSNITFRSATDALHALHNLAERLNRDTLIVLDAINEYEHPSDMRNALGDLLRKVRGKRIKLVVTCRDYYWNLFRARFWNGATYNELPAIQDESDESKENLSRFADTEHAQALGLYLDHYKIAGRPVLDAAEQCRHPLLLRFFCEAYRGQNIGEIADIRLKELFDRYWNQKLDSIAERRIQQGEERLLEGLAKEVGKYLLRVASYMLHNNVRAIPLREMSRATWEEDRNDPRSLYGRISDEFIILEEKMRGGGPHKSLQVAFVYEEFMEYVMARSLIDDWERKGYGDAEILTEIEALTKKYRSFAQILGVIVYLALMLKETRGLALWPLLLSQGKRWQQVIFEAIRKLPEEQLDIGLFDALGEMLATGKEDLQVQVLDALKIKRLGGAAPASLVKRVSDLALHKQQKIARRAVLALSNMPSEAAPLDLTTSLAHPSVAVRLNALKSLSKLGVRAVSSIIDVLEDPSQYVRQRAAEALGRLGDARAVLPLIRTLEDKDGAVRLHAVEALGRLGDVRAVPPLIATLKDTEKPVRQRVTEALEKIGSPAVRFLIDALKDTEVEVEVRRRVAEVLKQMGWQPPDEELKLWCFVAIQDWKAIMELGVDAVPALIVALKDINWDVRQHVAGALGKLGDARAVLSLIATLEDKDGAVRQHAAEALGRLGDVRAVHPLITTLKDKDGAVRLHAVEALGRLGDVRAIPPLIAILKDTEESVRQRVAEVLGKLVSPDAPLPIDALKDTEVEIRRRVAEVLKQMGWEPPNEELKLWYFVAIQNWKAIMELGVVAVPSLMVALKDINWDVRQHVAEVLGQLGDAQAVPSLITVLKDKNRVVRRRAAEALGKLGAPAIPSLVAAFGNENREVQKLAVYAFEKMGELAVPSLIETLRDPDWKIQLNAEEALRRIASRDALAAVSTVNDSPYAR